MKISMAAFCTAVGLGNKSLWTQRQKILSLLDHILRKSGGGNFLHDAFSTALNIGFLYAHLLTVLQLVMI